MIVIKGQDSGEKTKDLGLGDLVVRLLFLS